MGGTNVLSSYDSNTKGSAHAVQSPWGCYSLNTMSAARCIAQAMLFNAYKSLQWHALHHEQLNCFPFLNHCTYLDQYQSKL